MSDAPQHDLRAAVSEVRDRDVAVVGMAGRFPGARDLDEYWRLIAEGREAVTFLDADELLAAGVPRRVFEHPDYVPAASLLDGVAEFDAGFFAYTAREAEIMDPQQRLFLEHAWAALEDAACVPDAYDGLVGIYAGVAWNTYLLSNLREHRELFEGGGAFQVFITNDKDFMSTRASYKLNLKGPSLIVQTSCSTSLVAIHLAALSLLNYECDLALAGGVTVKVPQHAGYFYLDGGLASPDGHCRPFDADAAGTVFGSGVGVVALKRLADALDDGDPIRAVLRGSAINNDGSLKVSYTAPSVEGQTEVIAAAQAVAEVDPASIGYVECHGTGTSLGDPIEVTALGKAFRAAAGNAARNATGGGDGEAASRAATCALGSVKANVGHLDAAAGVAGFIKTVLALEHGQVPPCVHFRRPNPRLDLETGPFFVPTELAPWPLDGAGPRRAAVSSFGVGGTNAHAVLQQAPEVPPSPAAAPSRPWQLLVLSARSESALDAATARLRGALEGGSDTASTAAAFADVAHTLQTGRKVFAHRRFLLARERAEAVAALDPERASRLPTARDDGDPRQRPVIFLFPGQGAQHPGMGRELYDGEPTFRRHLDHCAEVLRRPLGLDLRQVLYPPPDADPEEAAARLTATELAQPALFAVEYALARLWMAWGIEPRAFVGHSLGEYVAACLAGVLSLDDALRLVARRGELMAAAPAGAMLAVPLPARRVEELLAAHPELDLAAVNEPERTVVSGPRPAVEAFAAELAAGGVEGRPLHTSHAFHSSLMDGAVEPFRTAVQGIALSPPRIPFVSNLSGTWIGDDKATDPGYWARHLRGAVRFADGLETLLADAEAVLLEVGPSTTLTTLARRHPRRAGQPVIATLPHPRHGGDAQASALDALGRLWLAGVEVDWSGLRDGEERRRVSLPTYPFEHRSYWIDAGPAAPRAEAAGAAAVDGEEGEAGKRSDVGRWFYRPSWHETAPLPAFAADDLPQRWWVLDDGSGPGAALARRLRELGREVLVVEPLGTAEPLETAEPAETGAGAVRLGEDRWAVRADDAASWGALLDAAAPPQAVIHAWCRDATPAASFDRAAFDDAQRRGLLALTALLQALPDAPVDLTVVAAGLLAVTAGEATSPALAPLLGAVRVLPQERAGARARAVDVGVEGVRDVVPAKWTAGSPDRVPAKWPLADRVLAEIVSGPWDGAGEVALRGDQRWLRRYRPQPLPAAQVPLLRDGGVYLVTGGLAGNGLALARYLARAHRARLLLVEDAVEDAGDSASEAADAEARRSEIAALGGEAHLLRADLADPASLGAALDEAQRRWGGVDGVVHAAGTYGERTFRVLAETGARQAAWHLRPKVHALAALQRALEERPHLAPGFVAVVSSLASVLGGLAYGAYTAGCLAADAFVAEHARRAGVGATPWLALDWDLWRFETEREEITEVRSDLAELAMSPQEGEEAFRRALAAAGGGLSGRLLVSTEALGARLAARRRRLEGHLGSAGEGAAAVGERHPRPDLDTPFAPPESDLERRIAAVWGELLGFDGIGLDDNFFELGGDSFVAVRTASRLKDELGVELPVARLYEGLTVRSLAALLSSGEDGQARRAEKLEERRQAADRRKQFQERRRKVKETVVTES